MRINNNLMAMNAYRQLGINQSNSSKSLEKLSSGLRINRAGDDAAGLAISEKMRGQIRGLNQASRNAQDGISLIQTAEGALQETHSILQRMRELAVQAANSTNANVDRGEIQNEINQLTSEINRIANTTNFNTKSLLNGEISITGNGREISSGADYGTGMSALDIIANSLLNTGDYKISVTNDTQNLVAGGQSGNIEDASVAQETVEIDEGSYRVNIQHQAGAKSISGTTDTNSLLASSGIDIYSGSSLAEEEHTIEVTMNTNRTVTNVNSGGLSNIDADSTAVGNYTISTKANVTASDATNTDLYKSDNSGAITDITIDKGSTLSSADNLKISVDQVTTVDDSFTVAHLVEQGLVFEAKDADAKGEDLSIKFVETGSYQEKTTISVSGKDIEVILGTDKGDAASLELQGLTFTANNAGVDGNNIKIQFVTGGAPGAVSTTSGDTITVVINEGTTTTQDIMNAIMGDDDAKALVTVTGGDTTVATVENATSLAGGGDNAVVNATFADIKNALDNSAAAGLIRVDYADGYTGAEAAEATAIALDFIDGSSEAETTFKFTLQNDDKVFGQATATFSDSSGSTTIKLGDVSFTVDNSEMFAGDTSFDAQTIALDINNLIRVTDSDGNYSEVVKVDNTDNKSVVFNTWNKADGSALVTSNSITMDINTENIGKGGFIRGNEYYINVDSTDEYSVQLKNASDEAIGEAYKFTRDDLINSSTYTNVGLGEMNSGLYVNFDATALAAFNDKDSKSIAVNIGTTDAYVAQLQNADGTSIGQTMTLNTSADQTVNLGNGVVFNYSNDDDQFDGGGQHYFSVKAGADNYKMTLVNSDDEQIGEAVAFQKGDTVDFGDTGLSIKTDNTITAGQETTFSIEDATLDNSLELQIGSNYGQSMNIDINDMRASAINISSDQSGTEVEAKSGAKAYYTTVEVITNGTNSVAEDYALDVSDHKKASAAIDVINDAIELVSAERSKLGAFQNRLEHTINNLGTSAENLTAAESRIRDVDMAEEMMEFTKNNILQQAAQAMLAQANQQPQSVLQLLR